MTTLEQVTYYRVIARETDMEGVVRCLLCGGRATDVHEILPRSFFGTTKQDKLFAENNRCCLCRRCHVNAHNDNIRKSLLAIMCKRYGYEYKGKAQWLLQERLEGR